MASKIDKGNENPTQYISSSSVNSFVMEIVTQVSNLFKNLDTNKLSIGIPDKLIKLAAEPLSVLFTHPLRWSKNYLYNRNQVVKIGDIISSSQTIICGIPQGSTLGPLLFLLKVQANYPSESLLMTLVFFR